MALTSLHYLIATHIPSVESANPIIYHFAEFESGNEGELYHDPQLSCLPLLVSSPNRIPIFSETTPLITQRTTSSRTKVTRTAWTHLIYVPITIILVSLITAVIYRSRLVDTLVDRQQWELERLEHKKEVLHWTGEIGGYKNQTRELTEKLGIIRHDTEDLTEEKKSLEGEVLELQERVRHAEEAARHAEEAVRHAQEAEHAARERQREYEKALSEQKERRAKMKLYWTDILADDQCLGHDRIHYRALLGNLDSSLDPVDACKNTNITINGVLYESPEGCEDVVRLVTSTL